MRFLFVLFFLIQSTFSYSQCNFEPANCLGKTRENIFVNHKSYLSESYVLTKREQNLDVYKMNGNKFDIVCFYNEYDICRLVVSINMNQFKNDMLGILIYNGWKKLYSNQFTCGNYQIVVHDNYPEVGYYSQGVTDIRYPYEEPVITTSQVYVCGGEYSDKFHFYDNCRGLNNCQSDIYYYDTQNDAINHGYEYCLICWE